MTQTASTSRLCALVFTDLAGSTALKTDQGDAAASELIAQYRHLVSAVSQQMGGRIIDWAGDGCFLTFDILSAGVQFAISLQQAHHENLSIPPIRVGVHLGEVTESQLVDGRSRVEGLAVDLAARISALAAPGQILISLEAFHATRQRIRTEDVNAKLEWRVHGLYELKGISEPVSIAEVGITGISPLTPPPKSEKMRGSVSRSEEDTLGRQPAVDLTVLIVEDDPSMQRILAGNLEFSGFTVRVASDGEEALQMVASERPGLILLDIMLPKINGLEVCRMIREDESELPIIMLTANGQESDIVEGLNSGADDYVTKPFSVKELLARVKAVLRRKGQKPQEFLQFGELRLDLAAHKLFRGDKEIPLTPKEFGLLELFAGRPGRAFTRDQILNLVWGRNIAVTTRSIDNCVNTLRKKIEADPRRPEFIKTIRNIGYRFDISM